jgi:hypothetical protein
MIDVAPKGSRILLCDDSLREKEEISPNYEKKKEKEKGQCYVK